MWTGGKCLLVRWTERVGWWPCALPPCLQYARHSPGAAMIKSENCCGNCFTALAHRFGSSAIRPSHDNRSQFARRGRFCRLNQAQVGLFRIPCRGSISSNTSLKTPRGLSARRLKSLARANRISRICVLYLSISWRSSGDDRCQRSKELVSTCRFYMSCTTWRFSSTPASAPVRGKLPKGGATYNL